MHILVHILVHIIVCKCFCVLEFAYNPAEGVLLKSLELVHVYIHYNLLKQKPILYKYGCQCRCYSFLSVTLCYAASVLSKPYKVVLKVDISRQVWISILRSYTLQARYRLPYYHSYTMTHTYIHMYVCKIILQMVQRLIRAKKSILLLIGGILQVLIVLHFTGHMTKRKCPGI